MPGILCLLGSDYFPSPHAGYAGEQINYAAQHNVSFIQNWKAVASIRSRSEAEFAGAFWL